MDRTNGLYRCLAALGLLVLAVAVIGPTHAVLSLKQLPPPVVATPDLERVFNEIDHRNQAEVHLEKELKKFQEQAEVLRSEAERLKADLELLVPGTEKYKQAETQWTETVLDYRATVAFIEGKLDVVRAEARADIYEAITTAAAKFADANGIDFIITDDSRLPLQAGNDIQIVQQLALRRVVYANPAFDITTDLIGWMNAP